MPPEITDHEEKARSFLGRILALDDNILHPKLREAAVDCSLGAHPDETASWWYPSTMGTYHPHIKSLIRRQATLNRVTYWCLDILANETNESPSPTCPLKLIDRYLTKREKYEKSAKKTME